MSKQPPKDYTQAVPFPTQIEITPIGIIHSPYKERHGTPRQSELQNPPLDYQPVMAEVHLFSERIPNIALKDLDGFERIWIVSWLHLNTHWNPTVRPPRGDNIRRGTLATRAPHRPNPIGLSCVRLHRVMDHRIIVEGIDLLDQTPVLDIKPYVPYCDAFPTASAGYVDQLNSEAAREKDIFGRKK